jgi:hypothetical protein
MGQTIFYESNNFLHKLWIFNRYLCEHRHGKDKDSDSFAFGYQKAKTKIGHPALMLGRDVHKL